MIREAHSGLISYGQLNFHILHDTVSVHRFRGPQILPLLSLILATSIRRGIKYWRFSPEFQSCGEGLFSNSRWIDAEVWPFWDNDEDRQRPLPRRNIQVRTLVTSTAIIQEFDKELRFDQGRRKHRRFFAIHNLHNLWPSNYLERGFYLETLNLYCFMSNTLLSLWGFVFNAFSSPSEEFTATDSAPFYEPLPYFTLINTVHQGWYTRASLCEISPLFVHLKCFYKSTSLWKERSWCGAHYSVDQT